MATAHPTTDHEDEPPSYTTTFPERDPLRTDVIKAACRALDHRAHSPFGSADARSIDRLRNWLCYMLTVDYKVATASTPVTLSAADAAHFDNLFATLEAYSNINATTTTTQPHTKKTAAATATADAAEHDDRAAALESAFWTHIHLPSQALNIPTATVALYLRRFAVNKTAPLATYAGSDAATVVLETTHGGGMRGWAAKLLTDRSILVPRVAPNRGVEQGLLRAIAELVEAWFVRLDGFECRVVEAQRRELRSWRKEGEGEEDSGWRHEVVGAFELTEMGRRWEERWRAAAEAGAEAMVVEVAEQQQQQRRQQQRSGDGSGLWERVKWRFGMLV